MAFRGKEMMKKVLKNVGEKNLAPGLKESLKKCIPDSKVIMGRAKRGLYAGRHIQFGNRVSEDGGNKSVHAIDRTPSMSDLNEILLGQVADDSTMYGCCVLVEELVQKPFGLLSTISDKQPSCSPLSRHILITKRCYCILSRLPFFELHFGVLNSIFTEERLEWLTKDIGLLNPESLEDCREEENSDDAIQNHRVAEDILHGTAEISELSLRESKLERVTDDANHEEHEMLEGDFCLLKKGVNDNVVVPIDLDSEMVLAKRESSTVNPEDCDIYVDDCSANKQVVERRLPNAVLPLLWYYQYESSESSSSFQGSPSEDRNFRSDADDTETEEASFSGQEYPSDLVDILEWAKLDLLNNLRIFPGFPGKQPWAITDHMGSTLRFHPLEHLHPLEYNRPDETVLHIAGSTINLRSCSTSLEFAEAHGALLVEEEASALSVWAISCICGSLRLENVLTLFAAALLEKQIVVVCSNLGILSASVLSIIPLIRPYQWQSLLMPVLPNDMLDFLDAPVPYIVGVKNKTNEVQSKLTNVILVDVNKNQCLRVDGLQLGMVS
ncbi:hypothetical protein SO802_029064 [Lithocarpus litseifolius]|uniref:UDENN domain-containing protein n=1 Tax=Lithocarpus litseifolius TaxID=425828 RepID=A0AAW2BV85_9ROSI